MTRSRSGALGAAALVLAAVAVSSCQGLSPDKIRFGRWVATTQPGGTDGVPRIDEAAALGVARAKLAELSAEGWQLDNAKTIDVVISQFVPSLTRLDSADGRTTQSSSEAQDAWVFEFDRPGRGAIVVVDADDGEVSAASSQ